MNEGRQFRKQVIWDRHVLPRPINEVISVLHSAAFIEILSTLTGVKRLVSDPSLYGAGLQQTGPGGHLNLHVDRDFHPRLKLYRRLTLLLYISTWRPSYGGELQLWFGYRDTHGDHLLQHVRSIAPLFNRMVIFSNSETSYHGYPKPITSPSNIWRTSISIFYYSPEPDPSYSARHHRARFVSI